MRFTPLAIIPALLALAPSAPAGNPAAPALLRYQLRPGESLRYRLSADIHGSVPIMDSPEPVDLHASIRIVYIATPKTKLADGTSDVDFKVETAELEVEKIPFPLQPEQAQEVLNQSVSMMPTGEVKRVQPSKPLPFGVSIPGVDPKRLYALLFPVVFQQKPVRPGDKWSYKSELLGGQGTTPQFTASWLPETAAGNGGGSPARAQFREQFSMGVDQKLDRNKKPVSEGDSPRYTRQGNIEGSGLINFSRTKGIVESGTINIKANVNEDLVGDPEREDQPKRMVSKIDATVRVQLEPKGSAAPVGEPPTGASPHSKKEARK